MIQLKNAKVVIVGGGVIGCATAYQLAKAGITDVVLLERKKIASGTSWHAAGILSEMRASESMIQMAKNTTTMFEQLKADSGHNLKFKKTGSLFVTANKDRYNQFKMLLSMAKSFDVEAYPISISEAKKKWPLVNEKDLVGAIFVPNDALICPQEGTIALAKGAQKYGATILENTKVTKILTKNGRAVGVETEHGAINSEFVIVTSGIWTRDFCADYNINVPLHAAEHYYILSEDIEGVEPLLPLFRDFDARCYIRPTVGTRWHEDGKKLMCGFFENGAKPWGMKGIPENFEFGRLNENWEHIEKVLGLVKKRLPALQNTKFTVFMNGPESFTYDNNYLVGELQNLRGLFTTAGFNSRGIQSSGGAAKIITEWVLKGCLTRSFDSHDIDLNRCPKHTANRKFLYDRTKEILGLLYDIAYPYLQIESARPIRTTPFHEKLKAQGACFGETAGWERANWYAPKGVIPEYKYSFGRQNWFEYSFEEHLATRENVTLFDQTSFAKYFVQGKDALKLLDKICPSRVDVKIGKVVYTQLLNDFGGIEGDITITRISESEFLILSTATSQMHDFLYIKSKIDDLKLEAVITDITSAYAVLGIMGPKSRELIQKMSNEDFSNAAFPFATSKMIDFGYARARATRITFVGELGWEIYLPTEFALSAYESLIKEGADLNLKHAGYHAMNSLRLEKSYIHWGHDVSAADSPVEANVGFTVHLKKETDFLGRDRLAKQKEMGVNRKIVTFQIEDSQALLYHYEPIYRNGEKVGHMTSGQYSPLFKKSIGLGYIHNNKGIVDENYILEADYKINILNQDFKATPFVSPPYDAKMEKIKS